MNTKIKLSVGLVLLLIIPSAMLELLNNIYNLYVPIFIQAGSTEFSSGGTITMGFGMGALMVGFWMIADNLFGFFAQPFVGAWSDRTKHRLGRRLPFIIGTLPFVLVGFAAIPLIPRLIPPELNGQTKQVLMYIILFTLSCALYYLGFTPMHSLFQALRQESVEKNDRIKVESWFNFILSTVSILAYTAGAIVYRIYGPLLFWIAAALYAVSVIWLAFKYKEPESLAQAAPQQADSNWKQLVSVLRDAPKLERRNLLLYLIAVTFTLFGSSAYTNFTASWAVNILGINEAQASTFMSLLVIASMVIVIPAGYIAAGKFGRKNISLVGFGICLAGSALLIFVPKMYIAGFVMLGLGAGAGFPSQLPLLTELTHDQSKLGSVIGVFNIFYLLGFVLGTTVVGAIIQATSYNSLFVATSGFLIIAMILLIFVKVPKQTEQPAIIMEGESLSEIPAGSGE